MKQMNKQQRLREIDGMRKAYLQDIAEAQAHIKELNLEQQNLIMSEPTITAEKD